MDISSKMQNVIEEQLKEIEEKENVKIIYCVESGSRAWGFASPDSDYDVRFIYVRNKEDYLKLNKNRDVIEWRLDDVLDINGWDIQKALRLLYKSNPTLFEWSMSPIVYKTTPQWEKISGIVSQYFLEKTGVYHYLSMAKGNYREYLKTDIVVYNINSFSFSEFGSLFFYFKQAIYFWFQFIVKALIHQFRK